MRLLGEDPGEPIPPDRPAARAGRQAAVAALHGRGRGAGVQPAAAAVHLLRPLRGPADAAAADDRDGAARPARPRTPGLLPGDRSRPSTASRVRYWEELEHVISTSAGKTLRFAHPARARRRGARRHARSRSSVPGPLRAQGARRLDRRVAALPPARDRRARSVVAGGAGGPQDVRLHHRRQRRSGRHLDRVRAGRSSAPGRRRCASTTCAAATRRCRSRTSRSRSRARRSSSRSRCSTPPGAATTRPASCRPSCSSSRSSPAAPPTRSACAAAIRSSRSTARRWRTGTSCASGWPRHPDKDFRIGWISPGGVAARGDASGRRSGRELDVNRQEEQRLVFGALNRLAWKTEVAGPDHQPVWLRARPRVRAHRRDHRDDGLRLRRDRPRAACR